MIFKPGFITPPWPHTPGDSVNAEKLIQRIEKEAHHGCGLYYEIYNYRVLCKLNDVLANLNVDDATTFKMVAASRGFSLDSGTLKEASREYQEIFAEIRREQK